jgi:hypothetical protein
MTMTVDNLLPFESPKELIADCKERIADFEAACKAFVDSCSYEVISHRDPNTREEVVKLQFGQRLPPRIRTLLSSIMKNLRIALDQALCDGAISLGRKNAKGILFPFGKDPHNLDHEVTRRCQNVDQGLVDFCLSFKPYYGGDSDGVLWSFNNLAGGTHQRSINVAIQSETPVLGEIIMAGCGPLKLVVNARWVELHNQVEIARMSPGSELHVNKNGTVRLHVIFSDRANALSFRPVIQTLHEICGVVDGIVLGIEAETARILRERTS